jgi:hypothetical protein
MALNQLENEVLAQPLDRAGSARRRILRGQHLAADEADGMGMNSRSSHRSFSFTLEL